MTSYASSRSSRCHSRVNSHATTSRSSSKSPPRRKRTISSCLTDPYRQVLQNITCGTGIHPVMIYGSQSNGRFALRLDGPWQKKAHEMLEHARSNIGCDLELNEDVERECESWPCVLLKLQKASEVDDEDMCHALANLLAPGISPRFLMSFTVKSPTHKGVRLTFMEWLDDCKTVYQLHRERSPILTPEVFNRAEKAIVDMWTRAGIIHCDLHPSNVMISLKTHDVYVIDYGMAIIMDDKMREKLGVEIRERGSQCIDAFNKVCRKRAYRIILDRGYNLSSEDDWNDDAGFLDTMYRYCCPQNTTANN